MFVVCLAAGSAALGVTVPAPGCGTAGHWDRCALKDGETWECCASALGNKGDARNHQSGSQPCPALQDFGCGLPVFKQQRAAPTR